LNLGDSLEARVNEVLKLLSLDNLLFYSRCLIEAYNEKNQLILQLPLELAIVEICIQEKSVYQTPTEERSKYSPTSEIKNNFPAVNKKPASGVIKKEEVAEIAPVKVNGAAPNLNQHEILEKWPEFLVKIKKYNHSLSFVLQNCEPQSLQGGILVLLFKYKFHQDRVNDASIKNIVENTLAEVFGGAVILNSSLDEHLEVKKNVLEAPEIVNSSENQENSGAEKIVESSASSSSSSSSFVNSSSESSAKQADIKKEPGAMMDSLLQAFGGEVIN